MTAIRPITPSFSVSGQLAPQDMRQAASRGVRLIVNNRPDGEEPGQPSAQELAQAAQEAGVAYVHVPVRGMPSPEQVEQMHQAVSAAGGPALAFCKSGMRSVFTWALGEQLSGEHSRPQLTELARAAGYDLEPYLPR